MIMINNLNEALVSMGYRKVELNKPLWMKPFCFSTIVIKIENNLITMKMLNDFNGNIEVWSKYEFNIENDSDVLIELKKGECELMKNFYPFSSSADSKFDFLTKLDKANIISNCI